MIELKIIGGKEVREFEKAHALRILLLPKSAWELTEDSIYELVNDELRRNRNKEADAETPTEGTSRRSKKSRK